MRIIFEMVRKEFLQLLRDKKLLPITLIFPIILLILFGYAVTTDIKNISWAILDQDNTFESRRLIKQFIGTGYFKPPLYLNDINPVRGKASNGVKEIRDSLDTGKATLVLNIPPDFQKKIKSNQKAPVQLILDGTDSNSAQIIKSYAEGIIQSYNHTLKALPYKGLVFENRIWFNKDLKSVNYMVPGSICQIIFIVTIALTALAIVKEKEAGTMELLMVSPIKPYQLILGKVIPFVVIAMVDTLFIIAMGYFWFKVPIQGNLLWLFILSMIFVLSTLGLGILLSIISRTQQQAMISFMFVNIFYVLLSGFMFPIENMPKVIQYITYIIPLRYFLVIVRSIFLKGTGLVDLQPQIYPMAALGLLFIILAVVSFKKKLS